MSVSKRVDSFTATYVLLMLVVVIGLVLIGQTWWVILQDRSVTLAAERDSSLQTVRLLEQHTSKLLDEAVDRMQSVVVATRYTEPGRGGSGAIVRDSIETLVRRNRLAGALQFTDTQGNRWASALDYPPFAVQHEARPFIDELLAAPADPELHVAAPLKRYFDSRLVLPMARNLYNHARVHVGVISTEVDLAEIHAIFAPVASDGRSTVQLVGNTGLTILRTTQSGWTVDTEFPSHSWPGPQMGDSTEGFFETGADSPQARQYTFRRSPKHPVIIMLGRDQAVTLAAWRERTRDRIATASVFAALLAVLMVWLLQQVRKLQHTDRSLRASESKFHRMFNRSPVPLALVDLNDGAWREVNEAFCSQFGVTLDGDWPQRSQAIWGSDAQREAALQRLRGRDHADHEEVALRRCDGTVLTCVVSTRMFPEEGRTVALFSPIDISRERAIENDIRELNTQLEQRVRERTLSLERQHEELQVAVRHAEQAGQAKAHVLAAASHDLRQPLHALSLYSAVLAGAPDASTLATVSAHIDASVHALNALLNSLLDLSKLDAGVFDIDARAFDLSAMLTRIANDYAGQAQAKGLRLSIDCPPLAVWTDPIVAERIVRNLVDNAVKYTDAGLVAVQACAVADRVQVCVRDTGRGIAVEDQARVFDEFYQVDNPGRDRAQGLGLGLSIVARLASLIGAELNMVSTLGVGTVFTWTLPLHVDAAPPELAAPAPTISGLQVLLIDDEVAIQHSMQLLLRSWGCVPFCASDPAEAEAILQAQAGAIDLLVVDLRLRDGVDGIALAHGLRARWGDIPVLLISGETAPSQLRHVEESGFVLLHKPLAAHLLRRNIEAARLGVKRTKLAPHTMHAD